MCISLRKKSLGLRGAVAESARVEGGSVIVTARPRKRSPRRPVCGKPRGAYDRLAARRWRALDLGGSRCYVEYAPSTSTAGWRGRAGAASRGSSNSRAR